MQLTNASGAVVKTYTYEAFGSLVAQSGTVGNPYQFSTKEYSSISGLNYFGARYYDPKVGRWITPDIYSWGPDDIRILSNNKEEMKRAASMFIQIDPRTQLNHEVRRFLLSPDERVKDIILLIGKIDPIFLHKYVYGANNPLGNRDPDGTFISPAVAGIVLIAAWTVWFVTWILQQLQKSPATSALETPGPAVEPVRVPPPQPYIPPGG